MQAKSPMLEGLHVRSQKYHWKIECHLVLKNQPQTTFNMTEIVMKTVLVIALIYRECALYPGILLSQKGWFVRHTFGAILPCSIVL